MQLNYNTEQRTVDAIRHLTFFWSSHCLYCPWRSLILRYAAELSARNGSNRKSSRRCRRLASTRNRERPHPLPNSIRSPTDPTDPVASRSDSSRTR